MNKKTFMVAVAVFALLFSLQTGTYATNGQPSNIIIIRADGSIDPLTAPITQVGTVYTFTQNITGSIIVEKDGVTIDGSGYTLKGTGKRTYAQNGTGIHIFSRSNVTIKNIAITAFVVGIYLDYYCNQTTILGNNFTNNLDYGIYVLRSNNSNIFGNNLDGNGQSGIQVEESFNNNFHENNITANGSGVGIGSSGNNTIFRNTIARNGYAFSFNGASRNIVWGNNVVDNGNQVYVWYSSNAWDNGSIGNYWSDYLTRYPNASEMGSTGIGDTLYVIDSINIDRYPLMNQVDIPSATPTPTPITTPEPTLPPTPTSDGTQAADWTPVVLAAVVVVAVAVAALVYLKRGRKH